MAIWRNIVNSSNIDLMRYSFAKNLSEVLGIFKAKVPAVDVVGKGERKLSLVEICRVGSVIEAGQSQLVSLNYFAVAEPFEHQLVREDALVVDLESVFIELQLN